MPCSIDKHSPGSWDVDDGAALVLVLVAGRRPRSVQRRRARVVVEGSDAAAR